MSTTTPDPLRDLFITFGKHFPQDDNLFLERCIYDQVCKAGSEPANVTTEDTVVNHDGLKVPCKVFRPASASKGLLIYFHGGGFSFGSPHGHRNLTGHLVSACGIMGVSVDYRLSPENVFPAAIDDCVAVYAHYLAQDVKPADVVFAGDSCGGCLATAVPLACLKRGIPVPAACVALSPCYDVSTVNGGTMDSNEEVDVLNGKEFCWKLSDRYIAGTKVTKKDPLVSPLFMKDEDAKRLPPHWISAGGYDMLCDHSERMADLLKRNGVDCELRVHQGMQHVFEFAAGRSTEADKSIRDIAAWVKSKFVS